MNIKPLLIVTILVIVLALGSCLMNHGLPWGYKTVAKDHGVLQGLLKSYFADDVDITAEGALVKVEVTVHGEKEDVDLYIFTTEEYLYWYRVVDDRIKKTREFEPVWSKMNVKKYTEEGIELPGPGSYLLVVHNPRWREAGVNYRWYVKDGD